MDGCLGGPGQGGMPGGHRLPADMLGQGLPRPKFGGVAEVLRFRAGQMDHPSFGLFRQLRGTAMRCVLESSGHPDFQGLAHPFGHALPSQVDGPHDGGDAFIRVVKPQNLSALHGTPRGRMGLAQSLQQIDFLGQQYQWRTSRSSRHSPSIAYFRSL